MVSSNAALVELIQSNSLFYLDSLRREERVLRAMLEVDRAAFLPASERGRAYQDEPVPIGYKETCSQPSMVAFILDKLGISPGNKILEVGSGCGYAAAVASKLCGTSGTVYACEVIPELAHQMRLNLVQNYQNIFIVTGDGSAGLPEFAPFDRIFLSAGVGNRFDRKILLDQLSDPGRLIYPEARGSLYCLEKNGKRTTETKYLGVRFVPLVGRNS